MKPKFYSIVLGVCTLIVQAAYAGQERKGGDPEVVAQIVLKSYILRDLKKELSETIKLITDSQLSEGHGDTLNKLISEGIYGDINSSLYEIADRCEDASGREHAAHAVSRDRGGAICFSPRELARQGTDIAELVGVAAHEHAHHFGIADKTHAFAAAIAVAYARIHKVAGSFYHLQATRDLQGSQSCGNSQFSRGRCELVVPSAQIRYSETEGPNQYSNYFQRVEVFYRGYWVQIGKMTFLGAMFPEKENKNRLYHLSLDPKVAHATSVRGRDGKYFTAISIHDTQNPRPLIFHYTQAYCDNSDTSDSGGFLIEKPEDIARIRAWIESSYAFDGRTVLPFDEDLFVSLGVNEVKNFLLDVSVIELGIALGDPVLGSSNEDSAEDGASEVLVDSYESDVARPRNDPCLDERIR